MSGYTPVFDSVFQGTLCGRWPDTGVWLCLLALADREGHIDSTVPYISAVTGIPAQTLTECIGRFMAPDPASRTQADDGRRLVLINPDRAWGWRVVNHGKYREKARLLSKNQREVETGKNKERMGDRRRPPETAADPLSDSDINIDKKKNTDAEVAVVFDHWRAVCGHEKAKLDGKRSKVIRQALKLYPLEDLKRCIDGYKRSAWHQGKNDRKQVYDDIELFLRDAKHIDNGIKFSTGEGGVQEWM